MIARAEFDNLHHQLATKWEAHQSLRLGDAPLTHPADSTATLRQAGLGMWDRHRGNSVRSG